MASFAPPAGVTGPTWTTDAVRAQVEVVAANDGVPVNLADAIAQHESGYNPYARGDYQGGQPTSFGLYQLHHGGELDSLPGSYGQQIAAAYDPATNARVALSRVAAAYKANPTADPGVIAATAQRPGDPAGYASAIDTILNGSGSATPPIGIGSGTANAPTGVFGSGTTTYKLTPLGPSITIWSWPRITFAVFGTLLVILGIYLTFRDSGSAINVTVDSADDTGSQGATTSQRTRTARVGKHTASHRSSTTRAAELASE